LHKIKENGEGTMIYTVTLNPSLDYIVAVENFKPGFTNRTSFEALLPGGKGINVSIVLKKLGMESTALGFAAGFTGEELVRRLENMGIRNGLILVEDGFTRINLKFVKMEGTEINGQGPKISGEKLQMLLKRLNDFKQGDVLFLSGSIPASMPDDVYQKIMETLEGRGVLTVVDAAKHLLEQVLPYHPFLVKPNHHELGEIFEVELNTRESVVPYAKKLQEMGAVNVLVSLAGGGAVLVTADGNVYESPAPKGTLVNGVGAGDSMVAGFMAGWLNTQDYRHAFYLGLAAGSASAFSKNLAAKEEIEKVYDRIIKQQEDVDYENHRLA
jgi:1-phosphofructokinase